MTFDRAYLVVALAIAMTVIGAGGLAVAVALAALRAWEHWRSSH